MERHARLVRVPRLAQENAHADRRHVVSSLAWSLAGLALVPGRAALAAAAATADGMQTRPVPSSGERLPVIGMGTADSFNVGDSPRNASRCVK